MAKILKGFPYIFDFSSSGRVQKASGAEKVKQNILSLLLTNENEIMHAPTQGMGLRKLLMEPNDDTLAATITSFVKSTIESGEPNAVVDNVAVVQAEESLKITISYSVLGTEKPAPLTVEFLTGGNT